MERSRSHTLSQIARRKLRALGKWQRTKGILNKQRDENHEIEQEGSCTMNPKRSKS